MSNQFIECNDLTLEEISQAINNGYSVIKKTEYSCGCIYINVFSPHNRFDIWPNAWDIGFKCGCKGRVKNVLTGSINF